MTLTPEARQRAREIAEAAPPFGPPIREQIRLILWGASSAVAAPAAEDADAA